MATDVHRRGSGRSLEGLSVVAGAAHLSDAGPKNNAQSAVLRASYQQYVGVSSTPGDTSTGQLSSRHKLDSFGPKLVQGDYTYTTSRKSLLVSSQLVGDGSLPPGGPSTVSGTATAPRGTIPAMVPVHSANINTAAWKAYGSPKTRSQRPPLAPGASVSNAAPGSPSGSKLPRVGGFKPRRPQSAPAESAGAAGSGHLDAAIAAIASSVSVGSSAHTGPYVSRALHSPRSPRSPQPAHPPRTAPQAHGSRRASARAHPDVVDVGTLAVDHPDPIWAGRTDSGRLMFEYTLPTDPYAKYLWEEQARKARANMARHIAAMAAAAAVNGGTSFSHGGGSGSGGGGGSSRPGSAMRSSGGQGAAAAAAGMGAAAAGSMRPRFSSSMLADVSRQGPDFKPATVVGFGAPDMTEDTTMPGPGDPRWAYTRLGRSQLVRLQQSLKMVIAPKHIMRPSSAPTLGTGGSVAVASGGSVVGIAVGTESSHSASCVGVTVGSPERSIVRDELSVLDPFADPTQGGAAAAAAVGSVSFAASATRGSDLEAQRSSPAAMARGTGSGMLRPGSAGMARPGSATHGRSSSTSLARLGSPGLQRPDSAGLARPGSAGLMRPGSVSATSGAGSAVNLAAVLAADGSLPAVPAVRGASAGRTREAAPNPRVDLRHYLAEAEAEAEDDDDGTEMLPVGDIAGGLLYDGAGGVLVGPDGLPLPPEVLQSMPVPADQLAARLAEMVAAVAVVAAQKQMDGDGDDVSGSRARVQVEEVDDDGQVAGRVAPDAAPNALPPPPSPPPPASPPPGRLEGDDALANLHNTSTFGGRPPSRHSGHNTSPYLDEPPEGGDQDDEVAEWENSASAAPPGEQPLGLGLGLGPRPASRAGRPTSARPTSARPTSARPTSAMPGRRSGSPVRGLGEGGGMDVILEQSEGGEQGEEY